MLLFLKKYQYINVRYLKNKKEFRSKLKNKKEIKKYKKNNELDLEKIIDEFSGYVFKIIKNMAVFLSDEDTEEIVSDTFFILWKNKEKLDEEKILSSYIAGIVKNLVKEKMRVVNINVELSDYENILQDCRKIDMICEQREEISIIEKAVKQMKEEDIFIFNCYYYSSMKINEIATILNISEFNVKSRLYRIRKRVKKELAKGGYSDEQ